MSGDGCTAAAAAPAALAASRVGGAEESAQVAQVVVEGGAATSKVSILPDEIPPRGIHPAKTLVQNDTAGDNGTAGRILHQLVLGFRKDESPSGRHVVR